MTKGPEISFVIPAKDEADSIPILYEEIVNSLSSQNNFEILFIDDGSTDNTLQIIKKLRRKDERVKVISLRGCFGKSVALQTGFDNSKGNIVITMDADLQDNPKDISKFIEKIKQGFDMVSGWKKKRYDPLSKTFPSKIGNFATRMLTGIKIHDLNCGFKAYKKDTLKHLHLYGELYKYIPVLAEKQNFKVGEVIVTHRPRKFGKSKFGWQRNIKGFLDMLTVVFLTGYLRRPAHFFGTFGILSFFMGFLIGLYISYLRLTTGSIQYRQPLLFLGILLMVVGVQLITTGLLAEMLVNFNQEKNTMVEYIKEKIG
ncbi:MAG: glycosyltransferase family 2 protein [bacterium]